MSEEAATAQEPEQAAATETVEPASTEQSPPDVGEALAQLGQRLQGIEERLPEGDSGEVDPWEALTAPPEEEPEQFQQPASPDLSQAPDEQQRLVDEFNSLVDERVRQMVNPHFEAQAREQRRAGILALAEEYPDFRNPEIIGPIGSEMQQLAETYGRPEMAEDPRLARRLYQAMKAEAVAAAETPAEAVSQGATLETGAGPGDGNEEASYQEQYLSALNLGPNATKDAFT